MKKKKKAFKLCVLILTVVLLVFAVIFFLPVLAKTLGYLLWLFFPFILAYLVSLLANPMANGLRKRFHLPRAVSAIIVIILVVGVVGGIIGAVLYKLFDEVKSLYNDFPIIYENVRTAWISISDSLSNLINILPEYVQNFINDFSEQTLDWFSRIATDTRFFRSAGNVAKKLPSIFISIIVFLISLYFMVTDNDKVTNAIKKPFTKRFLERISVLKFEIKRYIGGYFKAQLIIMCISFTILFIGLSIMKIKYAFVIAIATAILDAFPFFGSGAVLWPWAIVSFVTGYPRQGIGLLIVYFSLVLMRQLIEPKIVGQNIGLHPLMTLIAMYVGYRTLSIGGMIFGPFILMMMVALYKVGLFDEIITFIKMILFSIKKEINNIKISLNEGEE